MGWRNGPDQFGLITRVLHWTMAVLILVTLALGLRIASMEPGLSNLWLYGLHKTIGLSLLGLVVLRIVWHVASPPLLPIGPPVAMRMFVRAWHWTLYALMIAVPICGWAGSSASGIDTVFAETFVVAPLVKPSGRGEVVWSILPDFFAKTRLGMDIVHILATLRRAMTGEGTLTRMLRGRV